MGMAFLSHWPMAYGIWPRGVHAHHLHFWLPRRKSGGMVGPLLRFGSWPKHLKNSQLNLEVWLSAEKSLQSTQTLVQHRHWLIVVLIKMRNGPVIPVTASEKPSRCLGDTTVPLAAPPTAFPGKFPARRPEPWRNPPLHGLLPCVCPCRTRSMRSAFVKRLWTYPRICPASPISFQT